MCLKKLSKDDDSLYFKVKSALLNLKTNTVTETQLFMFKTINIYCRKIKPHCQKITTT